MVSSPVSYTHLDVYKRQAQYARDNGFDWFTTTLSISPHKDAARINAIGQELETEFGVKHLPCYIVIIAGFVTIVQMFMQAYMESLYNALGVFLPLIVVNCIILGRAEMFACKNNVVDSALDGVGMGLGYTLTATLMASIREILGSGTWLGFQIIPESVAKVSIMTQAPGAFFCYGILMAGCIWLEGKLDARIERKSCCDLDNLKKEAE